MRRLRRHGGQHPRRLTPLDPVKSADMPRATTASIALAGIELPDATHPSDDGRDLPLDLGALPGVWVLTAIRHRF